MAEMTEIQALASVCAEIDRVVRADPARRAPVANVLGLDHLPGYRWPVPRHGGRPSEALAGLPPVDQALAYLEQDATLGDDLVPSAVLALAGLAKADPQRGRNGTSNVTVAAVFGRRELNAAFGVDLGFEVERLATRAGVARVINEAGLNVDPVATFKTSVICHHYEMDDVKKVLTPQNWICFSNHWQKMTLVEQPEGRQGELHYRERVTLGSGLEALTVEACLRFVQSELVRPDASGQVLVLDYKRCGIEEHREGTGVLVDEGWLVADERDDGVLINTSKRVQFADETVDGLSAVMTACGLGYGRLARDFVKACLQCEQAENGWAPVEVTDGR